MTIGAHVLDLAGVSGLSEPDAQVRLAADGANALPGSRARSIAAIALEVVREPMFLMLVSAGGLYLAMGELADALLLLAFVVVVMGITIVQERRTERALDALRDLSSPRALVIRGGVQRRIAGSEVVRGDMLVIAEGDRVPADGLVRRAQGLAVDESLLTGESVPVRKAPSPDAADIGPPGGDDQPAVFSGTLVTSGQALVEVARTGPRTEIGRIGKALQELSPEATALERETRRMVRLFARVGMSACVVVVIAYAVTRGGAPSAWREGLLAGIAMAMATLPEEFPVVLTVFLALGARRIARHRVLTRRMPAVEMLGAATVLCVDKTGTLTENRMTLRLLAAAEGQVDLRAPRGGEALPPGHAALLEAAILASRPDPFDPMERALHDAAATHLPAHRHRRGGWSLVREYALAPELLAVSQVWRERAGDAGASLVVASKGAPEAIADLCRLTADARDDLARQVGALGDQGLRVLAVARGRVPEHALPEAHAHLALELVGLLGLEDPIRATVPAAVEECRQAGIRVVMITGDYPATARSIARAAGIEDGAAVITGPELAQMSDEDLAGRIDQARVFARVVPEQKLRIVQALKARREVVAMTGDGVNDAPALKAAHIGIAMGGRGTDVAREAASLVLLDDDFSSIVAAVRLGRRIFDNIQKAIAFIVAVHVPIAGLSMIPVFFGDWPLLLLPAHIVFLELVIDPSCSIVFEAEEAEPDLMRRPPRPPDAPLFSGRTLVVAAAQGLSVLAACLAVFLVARPGHGPDASRALTFATLVVGALFIILVNRSWDRSFLTMLAAPNAAFRWVMAGAVLVLGAVLTLPGARALFRFAPLHADDLVLSLIAGGTCVLWFELLKKVVPRRAR